MNNFVALAASVIGIAGIAGAASAVLISSRTKNIMELQGTEISTLKDRVNTETQMRPDCQRRLTILEEQGPSLVSLTKMIVDNHKQQMELLAQKLL